MPEILIPALQSPTVQGSPALANTLQWLGKVLKCPPHLPNIRLVIDNAAAALQAATSTLPSLRPVLAAQLTDLLQAQEDLNPVELIAARQAMMGLVNDHPAWALFASGEFPRDQILQSALGLQLAIAILRQVQIDKRSITECRRLLNTVFRRSISTEQYEQAAQELQTRAFKRVVDLLALASSMTDAITLNQNAGVVASIRSGLSSMRTVERQAAGRDNELSDLELRTSISRLLEQAQAGDGDALALVLAFTIGLPWDLAKQVPLCTGTPKPQHLVWVDPREGWIYVNLSPVLTELAQQCDERHVKTSMLLRRPLPIALANLIEEGFIADDRMLRIEGLIKQDTSSRAKLNLKDLHHSASIARLIASSGSAALRLSQRRDLSAFATLSFELVSKSDLHYIAPREDDVWGVCNQLYEHVGLGPAVPTQQGIYVGHLGSRVTPEVAWVREVFIEAKAQVCSSRSGRRYSLEGLVKEHNAFARYVGMFLQLVLGGRNRRQLTFSAQLCDPGSKFALILDKPIGPTQGFTPLPLSATTTRQIQLWRAHIHALARRLQKIRPAAATAAVKDIDDILEGKSIALLFTVTRDFKLSALQVDDIFFGEAVDLNRDFGRHFMSDQLCAAGLSFEDVQAWLRHHTPGVSRHCLGSEQAIYGYLNRTGMAIDRVLASLNICPLAGISQQHS